VQDRKDKERVGLDTLTGEWTTKTLCKLLVILTSGISSKISSSLVSYILQVTVVEFCWIIHVTYLYKAILLISPPVCEYVYSAIFTYIARNATGVYVYIKVTDAKD
jgi:hypothetical protein